MSSLSSLRLRPLGSACLALFLFASAAAAQDRICPAGRISFVYIDARSIFDADDPGLDGRVRWAYRAANALHVTTRESTVQRELLLAPGDCYDPFLLAESERLLRLFSTFARVDVFGIPQPDGDWHVIVATRDEWSTQVDVRFRFDNGVQFEGARLYETNLLGRARTLGLFYYERDVQRDYGVVYATPQLFRTRTDGVLAIGRTRAGSFVRSEISYPFLGEIGHSAGRLGYRREEQFFDYIYRDDPALQSSHVLVPMRVKFIDASFVHRFGDRGRAFMLGGALTYDQNVFNGPTQVAPSGDFDTRTEADSAQSAAVLGQRSPHENMRASVLLGFQNIAWVKRRGLDVMRGEQDLRVGAEGSLILGRTVHAWEGRRNYLVEATGYAGFYAFGGFFVGRALAETRRDIDLDDWTDSYLDGDLFAYFRYAAMPRHTVVLRAGGTASWSSSSPFQITLGGERALRGYDLERFPGGRRILFSAEDRIYLGWPWRDLFDTGITLFADAGRMWAGDAPFGEDSGWQASAGFGIRSSFPAGGRTTYRLDFAWPVSGSTSFGDLRIRLSIGEVLGVAQREIDPQLLRSRLEVIGGRLLDVRHR